MVSGPGVKSSLVVMGEVFQFVGVVEDVGQHDAARCGVGWRLLDQLPADVGSVDHDVLDCIRRYLARILAHHNEVGQLAGRD